jgi:hypothetical protein
MVGEGAAKHDARGFAPGDVRATCRSRERRGFRIESRDEIGLASHVDGAVFGRPGFTHATHDARMRLTVNVHP